jgi:hypothetical protein
MVLTVLEPSIISTQPNSVNTCEGSNALFEAVVSGQTNTYQWQVSTNGGAVFTNLTGANSTALTIASVNSSLSGNYYQLLVVGCGGDTIISNQVTLTVSNQTEITVQPVSVQACVGGNAVFQVTSSGSNLQYQWQMSTDGGTTYLSIAGATNVAYTINSISILQNQNKYRVVIVNSCGNTTTSQAATLTVTGSATFTLQPQSVRVCDSSIAEFQVGVAGNGYQIQWQMSVDGGASYQDIAGANGLQFSIPMADMMMDGNKFRVKLNSCDASGIFSNEATLTIVEPAVIRSYAVMLGVCEGDTMQFAVNVSGTAVVYQWEISRDGGLTYAPIVGQNSSTLVFNGVSDTLSNNLYRLIVSNECTPPTTSNALVVSITTPASIVTHPQTQQVCVNGSVSYQIQTTGSVVGYQWQKSTDGGLTFNDINGETTNNLQLNGVQQGENGNRYRVAVFGTCPRLPLYSDAASLQIFSGATVETQPNSVLGCVGENAIFRASIQGNQPQYQWQKSINGGLNYADVNGANADTLLVSNITAAMNNDRYRLSVSDQPCGIVTNQAVLQINPGPVVEVRASPYRMLLPGLSTTVFATATPASDSFYWYKDGALLDYGGSALVVGYGERGNYKVNSRLGCTHNPAIINIGDSAVSGQLVYPNPTQGKFIIRLSSNTNQKISLTVFDDKGSKIIQQTIVQTTTNLPVEGNLSQWPSGVYAWILRDENGNEMGRGKIIKL